ncbi:phosphotransferase [Saccharibacillus sp. CPCC 101409]|uniref:phosphotransferase n=1 Tax=Saccharibacillus sp. CPCC 101409 TaxID=3058041 RepID=UPI0026722111|nr:phosphotransferase [Saccharibacillus sp. CPCC 101409]MDO3409566.1 phosphotransferase [Saccharibacillus sp. CPCC 101409]
MSKRTNEEKLSGGNVSDVFKQGGTVRREIKPDSGRIHELLNHLEIKGCDFAPRYLGIDEQGREVLSFIEGEAGNYPLKTYMWKEEALEAIARMLRAYHDAVSDFPFDESWLPLDGTPQPMEVVCHNDFAVYNIVFRREMSVGIIDFDMAAPGPKIWDIAYALYTCAPLSRFYVDEAGGLVHYVPARDESPIRSRIQRFFEAYGIPAAGNTIETVLLRLEALCATMARKAAEGDPAFRKMIDDGHLDHYRADIVFVSEHGSRWM